MVNEIIADPEVLEEEYIPQNIPYREFQERLTFCLSLCKMGCSLGIAYARRNLRRGKTAS